MKKILFLLMLVGIFSCSRNLGIQDINDNVSQNTMTYEKFKASLFKEPWQGGAYIVEGDIPIFGENALQTYYLNNVATSKLLVNTDAYGTDTVWNATQKKQLTYCISDTFGTYKNKIVTAMNASVARWENAIDVDFIYLADQDSNCTNLNTNVVFDINPVITSSYSARAFLPNYDRVNRNILVSDYAYINYSDDQMLSTILHELGHTLGFRHDHIRSEALVEGGQCIEDSQWRALTDYDRHSIMHYSETSCNGFGSRLAALSYYDVVGARKIYGATPYPQVFIETPNIIFDFIGAEQIDRGTLFFAGRFLDDQQVTQVELKIYDITNMTTPYKTLYPTLYGKNNWYIETTFDRTATFIVSATATDNSGNKSTAHQVQESYNTATTTYTEAVKISSPANQSMVAGVITVNALFNSPTSIIRADYYVDGIKAYTTKTNTGEFVLDTSAYPNGIHVITARALNGAYHNLGTAAVVLNFYNNYNDIAPVINNVFPVEGQWLRGTIPIRFKVQNMDSNLITKAEIYLDNNIIYTNNNTYNSLGDWIEYEFKSWNTAASIDGTHVLKFVAYDDEGQSRTQYINVNLDNTNPSVVQITSPVNHSVLSGTTTIIPSLSDNSMISKVEVMIDGALARTLMASPFQFTFDTNSYPNGGHDIMIIAYDIVGNKAQSNTTTVTINNIASSSSSSSATYSSTTTVFDSNSTEDGYIKANADGTSPAVGTNTTLALGRGTDSKYNRSILSFDTSNIPDNAIIVKAFLTVTYSSIYLDPWTSPTGNSLVLDVKSGYFGTTANTETADYTFAATADNVASIAKFTSGTKASTDFNASGLSAINKTGKTQLKLRFLNNQTASAYLFITQGSGAKLTVVYQTELISSTPSSSSSSISSVSSSSQSSSVVSSSSSSTTTVFDSNSTEDGYIKATSTGTSPAVGTSTTIAIGRGTDSLYNRAILSFDTSTLPDTATILRAYLTITFSSIYSDPWASPTGNSLVLDLKSGYFGTTANTETTDWSSAATSNSVASIAKFTSGTKASSDFNASGLSAINKTGKTQIKLRFLNNQTATAYLFITQGSGAKLTVIYQ
jgi:hypothetical protein